MPYSYKHKYETQEDIDREYGDTRRHSRRIAGTFNEVRVLREEAARERQEYLETLDFEDQMAARNISLNVDARNKYQLKSTISMLQGMLDELEKENFEVPYNPGKLN